MDTRRWKVLAVAVLMGIGTATVVPAPAQAAVVGWGMWDHNAGGGVSYLLNWGDVNPAYNCVSRVGDWDGNGRDGIGLSCPVASNGTEYTWFLQNNLVNNNPTDAWFNWGGTSCLAITGDWNGDRRDTPGVVCADGPEWRWSLHDANAAGGVEHAFGWGGTEGCWPIVGDWNGDRRDTPGLVCPQGGVWRWALHDANAGGGVEHQFTWGSTACSPLWGDWDGNGTDTPATTCAKSNGEWEWSQSNHNTAWGVDNRFAWGSTVHRPLVGDWNGDGVDTIGTVNIPVSAAPPTGYSLPLPRTAAPRSEYDDPHHDYPAIDIGVPTGTPAYAAVGGTVRLVNDSSCGLGVVIRSNPLGADFVYCHFSAHTVGGGATVSAGQQIGRTGSTGNSTGPHLHFAIKTNGLSRCPQRWLLGVYDRQVPPAPSSLPTAGCFN